MKKTTKISKQITTPERERLDNLVELVMDKYDMDDIVCAFLDKIDGWQNRKVMVKRLLKDDDVKADLKLELTDEINAGMFIVKIDTIEQKSKLTDFICSQIYPYYNEQQQYLFD